MGNMLATMMGKSLLVYLGTVIFMGIPIQFTVFAEP